MFLPTVLENRKRQILASKVLASLWLLRCYDNCTKGNAAPNKTYARTSGQQNPRAPTLELGLRASNPYRSISSVHLKIGGHLSSTLNYAAFQDGLETTLTIKPRTPYQQLPQ